MRLLQRRPTILAAVLVSALLVAGCDALDGDAMTVSDGVFDGDVAASSFDGDVRITVDELAELVTIVDGRIYDDMTSQDPNWGAARARQREFLSVLLTQESFVHAAERDFGIDVTDQQIEDELLARAEEEAGSLEEFEAQLAETGGPSLDVVRLELRWRLTDDAVTEQLAEPDTAVGEDPASQWRVETLEAAEPEVDPRFGVWNPAFLRVDEPGTPVADGAGV